VHEECLDYSASNPTDNLPIKTMKKIKKIDTVTIQKFCVPLWQSVPNFRKNT